MNLFQYIEHRLDDVGGNPLVRAFRNRWGEGECLILLDGLDEISDTSRRIGAARHVDGFVQQAGGNHVLITSRPIGYSICRISVPIEHVILRPFSPEDISTFVRKWYVAYDRAIHPDRPDPLQAEAEAKALYSEIQANPRVQSLATNPLMLTIIALIKHQNVTLPERRVQFYEMALNTLMRSWNKARSLSNRPIGEDLSAEESKKVWGAVADWMHREKSTGTCSAQQLQARLVEILREFNPSLDDLKAEQIADSYITSAKERSGLLEARGATTYAFMHQTFQEYLAARHLVKPHSRAIDRAKEVARNPRWHEVIRLAAGFIGVIQEDDDMATEFVVALAKEESDPLEPYLRNTLRLAASCIADDIRIRRDGVDLVINKLCNSVNTAYPPLVDALAKSLASMRTIVPGPEAVRALKALVKHDSWQVRMEVARMLGRVANRDHEVIDRLRDLIGDPDRDVQAVAALGLWKVGFRQ